MLQYLLDLWPPAYTKFELARSYARECLPERDSSVVGSANKLLTIVLRGTGHILYVFQFSPLLSPRQTVT